eukprot:g26852.t1
MTSPQGQFQHFQTDRPGFDKLAPFIQEMPLWLPPLPASRSSSFLPAAEVGIALRSSLNDVSLTCFAFPRGFWREDPEPPDAAVLESVRWTSLQSRSLPATNVLGSAGELTWEWRRTPPVVPPRAAAAAAGGPSHPTSPDAASRGGGDKAHDDAQDPEIIPKSLSDALALMK